MSKGRWEPEPEAGRKAGLGRGHSRLLQWWGEWVSAPNTSYTLQAAAPVTLRHSLD